LKGKKMTMKDGKTALIRPFLSQESRLFRISTGFGALCSFSGEKQARRAAAGGIGMA